MMTTQLAFHFVKSATLILNGVFVPISLLGGLLYMAADTGARTAISGMGWAIVLAGASVIIMAALIRSERRRPLIRAAYCASTFILIASGWEWCDHFNGSSDLFPPTETVIYGCLALLNTASLAMTRPLHLAPLLEHRSSRIAFFGLIAVLSLAVLLFATFYIQRITSQYPYAEHFLRLGGGIRWENGWVVGLFLKNTNTTDEDLRSLTRFRNLRSLYLSDTPVTDAGLAHIATLRSLEHLYLDNTAITDRGVQYLSGLTMLRNLWMHRTKVTDQGLVYLEGMTEMGYLDLGFTKVTDVGLPHLYGMKKIYYLHLVGTEVTDDGLRRIAAAIPGLSTYNGRIAVDR